MDAKFACIIQAHSNQLPLLEALVKEVVSGGSVSSIRALAERILSDQINSQLTRSGMVLLAKEVVNEVEGSLAAEGIFEAVAELLLGAMKNHVSPLDEADYILRDALFSYHIGQEEYSTAAQFLAAVNLESTARVFSDAEKADIYIKCAEAVLEDDEAIDAEVYMNKASAIINNCTAPEHYALQLRFRVTYARVLDANRKFVEAAQRYYELSTTRDANVVESDLLELLAKAITCAVLGKTGPPRSRVLALLYQDDRLGSLDAMLPAQYADHAVVLGRVFKEQMLLKEELKAFENCLMPHQKATTKEGFTLLEKAVIEHNILAVGKIYDNISLVQLARILGLAADQAEKIVATMVTENRLRAIIDQAVGYALFLGEEEDEDDGGGAADFTAAVGKTNGSSLTGWDDNIKLLCEEVTDFVNRADQRYLSSC